MLAIVCLLAAADGAWVTSANLTEAIWGDDPSGGPIDPKRVVHVFIHRLRHLYGIPIEGDKTGSDSRGYRLSLRRVVA